MFVFSDPDRSITAHRNPTQGEINRGYGAIHYKDFPRSLWESFKVAGKQSFSSFDDAKDYAKTIFEKSGAIVSIEKHVKRWIVCPIDGLRYYR